MADYVCDNGDVCVWTYGGLTPVIEGDALVAIDVMDAQGRARVRVPWDDILNTALARYHPDATRTTTTGEAVSVTFPECH